MGLYQHPGYKRIAIVVPIVVAVAVFIIVGINSYSVVDPLIWGVSSCILTYILIRLIFWIIDGFKNQK